MPLQSGTPAEKELLGEISRERLWRDTEALGSRYRASGSEEERWAVRYVVEQLKQAGVDVSVYELNAFLSYHKSADCVLLSPESGVIPCVARAYSLSTPEDGVELDLVVAGEDEGDLTDKAVLTARDWPSGSGVAGARVQIHAQTTNEPNLHRGGGTPVWGTPTVEQLGRLAPQPSAINISRPDGERLRTLVRQGRVRIRVRTEVETGWRPISFPVASIPGREPTFVLTGGHLDSHDPGATDNATGCAALLELARAFGAHRGELRHGLRVGWWTGHESAGYAGSTWYSDNEWENLRERCLLYWNNDGPGIRGATNVEGRYIFPQIEGFVVDLIREYFDREPDIMAKPLKMGDQSFWSVGVPSASVYRCLAPDHPDWAVVFGAGHGRWWHSTEDTLEYVDPDVLVDDTRFYALALYRLCCADVPPFEFVTYAAWMRAALTGVQEVVGSRFDVTRLIERVDEFEVLARSLQEAAQRSRSSADPEASARISGCLARLSRYLNPVFLTAAGPYDQDLRGTIPGPSIRYPLPGEPAFEPRYFPGLQRARQLVRVGVDSPEYTALYTALLRERNRIGHALRRATEEVRTTLSVV